MERRKKIQQMTGSPVGKGFRTEEACQTYLLHHRWPTGFQAGVAATGRSGQCPDAFLPLAVPCLPQGYRFSVIAGTIFENTNKPLRRSGSA